MALISSEIFCRVLCILTIIFQGTILNKYLVLYRGDAYWAWFMGDAITVFTFFLVEKFSQDKLKERHEKGNAHPKKDSKPDSIKFVYITWLTYAVFLVPRVCILFYNHADKIEENTTFGPNFLKAVVACTPIIFLFLLRGHHNGKFYVKRKYYIALLIGTVSLDLFDSIELLEYLFTPQEERAFSQAFADTLLSLSVLNFFLPVLALLEIRVNQFSGRSPSLLFKTAYMLTLVFVVNVPNLIMRSILWSHHEMEVSVLLMKNVICIIVGFFELYEFFREAISKKCKHCGLWYEKKTMKGHLKECAGVLQLAGGDDDDNDERLTTYI